MNGNQYQPVTNLKENEELGNSPPNCPNMSIEDERSRMEARKYVKAANCKLTGIYCVGYPVNPALEGQILLDITWRCPSNPNNGDR